MNLKKSDCAVAWLVPRGPKGQKAKAPNVTITHTVSWEATEISVDTRVLTYEIPYLVDMGAPRLSRASATASTSTGTMPFCPRRQATEVATTRRVASP